jgi:hypothetical protein
LFFSFSSQGPSKRRKEREGEDSGSFLRERICLKLNHATIQLALVAMIMLVFLANKKSIDYARKIEGSPEIFLGVPFRLL